MKEKISIIVPIYNSARTLGLCIESLLSQTYGNKEIILVNDGSKDDSLAICESYAKEHEEIILLNKVNGGVSSARNAGLKMASGPYTLFVDSDDYLSEDYLTTLCDHCYNCDLVVGGFTYFGSKVAQISPSQQVATNANKSKDIEILFMHSLLMNTPWGKLYRTHIIKERNLRFDENMKVGEDTCFVNSYLSMASTVSAVRCCGYMYRYVVSDNLRKYTLTPESYGYHISTIVNSYKQLTLAWNLNLTRNTENVKTFLCHTYIETLKRSGIKQLYNARKYYKLNQLNEFAPQNLALTKRLLLFMSNHAPIAFWIVTKLQEIKNGNKNIHNNSFIQ